VTNKASIFINRWVWKLARLPYLAEYPASIQPSHCWLFHWGWYHCRQGFRVQRRRSRRPVVSNAISGESAGGEDQARSPGGLPTRLESTCASGGMSALRNKISCFCFCPSQLVSLMIGNNDVCSEMCYWKDPSQIVSSHYWGVRKALDYLRDNLPRTFVNVIPMISE
jgi:hypothetical protein